MDPEPPTLNRPNGFRNPVIPGFHPDPSICRVGDEYFLAVSSFTWFPGVPIFRSTNLVDWTQIGHALDRVEQLDLSDTGAWASLGVFAPTLRHHDGRFWLITTVMSEAGPHNFVVTADDPAGPWSDPLTLPIPGIDPDIAWDHDGNCWVHYSAMHIARLRIDPATGEVLDGPEVTWSGTGMQYPEAPHLIERDGWWYLLIAEGGTERCHAVSIARAPSPTGPWEGCPANPILSHRSLSNPIQSTGHADLVQHVDGSWWMVFLGTRPRGITPGFYVLGRETFLAPVEWVDGWPEVGPVEIDMVSRPTGRVESEYAGERVDFDQPTLDHRWAAVRRPPATLSSLDERPGWLSLNGTDATLDSTYPVLLARRQQHQTCRVRCLVDLADADEAGLTVLMNETLHTDVALTADRVIARSRIGPLTGIVGEAPRTRAGEPVVLVIETVLTGEGPDTIVVGFEDENGSTQVLAELDGRYLSTEVAGGFMGRMIGMYAVGGTAHFDWFEYLPTEP